MALLKVQLQHEAPWVIIQYLASRNLYFKCVGYGSDLGPATDLDSTKLPLPRQNHTTLLKDLERKSNIRPK